MRKILSIIIIGILVQSGLGAAAIAPTHTQRNTKENNPISSPYVDELDQSMTDFDGALPMGRTNIFGFYANLSVAQTFIPQKEVLTRAQFLMARNATTSQPCVLAIRDNLTGENLARVAVASSEFPIVNGTPTEPNQLAWINYNFDDIWVTPGKTYDIVVYTANVTDNFYWVCGNGTNIYPNGTVYLSINDGRNWTELVDADGCFKTYGLCETFLTISINSNLFGPSFVIKNTGNHTAWDVTYNISIEGGILGRIQKTAQATIPKIEPGNSTIVRISGIFGFGALTLSMRVAAANVHEQEKQIDAKIILIFWIV
jgi:hypothetical protein